MLLVVLQQAFAAQHKPHTALLHQLMCYTTHTLCCLSTLQVYKLPAERLYATYFGGDEKQGLPADDEAKNIWLRFLPTERVLPFGCKVGRVLIPVPASQELLHRGAYQCGRD